MFLANAAYAGGTRFIDASNDRLDLIAYEAMREDNLALAKEAFTEILSRDSEDAFAHMWLGQIAVRLGDMDSAENEFTAASAKVESRMSAADDAEAYARRAKRAQLDLSLQRVKERHASQADMATFRAEDAIQVDSIPRIHRRDLGHSRFQEEFSYPRQPVIIEGFEEGITEPYLSIDRLRDLCGELPVPLRRHAATATSWGGLEEMGRQRTLAEHLDSLEQGTDSGAFVFDWPLRSPSGCQRLLNELRVPSYFTGGIVSAYGPSLFAQGNGTKCGMHVDARATHFWQYVNTGRKVWRIFRPEDWPRLFEAKA